MRLPVLIVIGACGCGAPPPPPAAPAVRPALVNGDFSDGLTGWSTEGDGARFRLFADAGYGGRRSLTTFVADETGGGGAPVGSVFQDFEVPMDAVALRFVIHGGRGKVRLLDGATEVYQVSGPNDNDRHVPVSWALLAHRGKTLRLSIEDRDASPPWAFVSTSGFDVIRDVPCAIVNADFGDGFNGWDVEGDAAAFPRFRDPLVGNRWSVTTAAPVSGKKVDAARGTLSQAFTVPTDALALRFFVHGGARAAVRLWRSDTLVYEVSGLDDNDVRVPVSWDLKELRGERVRLAVEDAVGEGPWAFIGTSGFDLVTVRNGP